MNFGIIVNNLIVIFAMIAVGLVSGRLKIISDRAQGDFTAFLMNITLPCTIFMSMIREYDSSLIRDSIVIFILGIVFFGGGMLALYPVSRLFKVPEERRGVWTLCGALCNTGFMGFPLVKAVFGDEGLFLASIMNLAYNCVAWTLGAQIACRGSGESSQIQWRKILFTNVNYAVAIGMVFFLLQIPLPETIRTVVQSFGNITTPLSMFLIGLNLAGGSVMEVFRGRDVRTATLMRLVIIPLVVVGIMHLLPLPADTILRGVVILIMSMPCPSMALMLALQYKRDTHLASEAIFLSSLCCIVTIPLIMFLI